MLVTDDFQCGFFEGTEKLLEVWFGASDANTNSSSDLRDIPRQELEHLLSLVRAEIVSSTSNEWTDSYVLSESSMFVSSNRFIIKTCGTTSLLSCLEFLIQLAGEYCGFDNIKNFFYSRRVYLKPELQEGPHKTFEGEVLYLQEFVPGGSSYVLGHKLGEEWYLYTMDNSTDVTEKCDDITLEILMSDLDQQKMSQFSKARYPDANEMTMKTGISDLIPGAVHDGVVFDPIGYSMNGLFNDSYHTIHITPQEECSYVSFETNIKLKNYSTLINKVLRTFKPGNFILTYFVSKNAMSNGISRRAVPTTFEIDGYQCVDLDQPQLKNYLLTYSHYVKV